MKIAFFSPSYAKSAIGRSSKLVVDAFVSSGNSVDVIATEATFVQHEPRHHFSVPVHQWTESTTIQQVVSMADVIFYQIGDNFSFHQGAIHWLNRAPGFVILHDYYLADLFYDWAQSRMAEADEILRNWYGKSAATNFFKSAQRPSFVSETAHITPMVEWIASQATAVITHSDWGIDRVMRACPGIVKSLALPYTSLESNAVAHRSVSCNDCVRLLTIGHANKNKRIEQMLEALASSEALKQKTTYALAGKIDSETQLKLTAFAQQHGINFECHGEVDDKTLQDLIDHADVICCLRHPALEAASASCVEAMLNGKPTIVTDTGFYSELPDDCVLKINPLNEATELPAALEALVNDASLRKILGEKAQKYATETFSPQKYAQELLNTAEEVSATMPLFKIASVFGSTLKHWGALDLVDSTYIREPLKIFEPER